MPRTPLVSVIIDNYNYARFLATAIDSALAQTHASVEVVVVDDGSTDESRHVIAGYGDRVIPVFKPNGGMASAFNAGLRASRGEFVVLLDSDDVLLPEAAACAVEVFVADPEAVKVHWPLAVIDAAGKPTGAMFSIRELSEGHLKEAMIRNGPFGYVSSPTSGNAWRRSFLEQVMPIPEESFRRAGEAYLVICAPQFGTIRRLAEPLSLYRIHGENQYGAYNDLGKARYLLDIYPHCCRALADCLARFGIEADADSWRIGNPHYEWWCRLDEIARTVDRTVPPRGTFVLADEDQCNIGPELEGRRRLQFMDRGGKYWGAPADDDEAIAELERFGREEGASHLLLASQAFWWLEHYPRFARHLHDQCGLVTRSENLMVFNLSHAAEG